jgi:nitroimidazol reductase NimA-like FMN-containing flavoprotein (pyridoxamine 5'-phosphate oxidase superfamily)
MTRKRTCDRAATSAAVRVDLTRDESLRLLGASHYGRLLLSVECLPEAQPVFLDVVDDDVVAVLGPGPELEAATRGDVVALEVDGSEQDDHVTWSVRVTGIARALEAKDPARCAIATTRLGAMVGTDAAFLVLPLDLVRGERTRWTTA